ncbi:condensation domain-containing protein, partial [Roseateles sp. BYS180W]
MPRELEAIARRLAALEPQARGAVLRKMAAQGIAPTKLPIVAQRRNASAEDGVSPSYAQLRQWFLWQLNPRSSAYHLAGALRLVGSLDEDALRAAFDALVQRHEALRTVFRANARGDIVQVVLERGAFAFNSCDLRTEADRERRAQSEAQRIVQEPFDLSAGPLLRIRLIRLDDNEQVLVVVMHHIVSDGWSIQLIVEEFAELYAARLESRAPTLRPLDIQYADYALWQRDLLAAGERDRQLAYWTEHLGGTAPALQLPVDHPRHPDGAHLAARLVFDLPTGLAQALRRQSQSFGATPFMLLLAAWQGLLYRWAGQDDIRVGVPIANRHRAETEGVIGFFANTQVLRAQVDPRMNLAQLLAQTREAALGAQAHQDLPFEQLVEALQPERVTGQHPLFQVMFSHQVGEHRSLDGLPGLSVHDFDVGDRHAQFDLSITTAENGKGEVGVTLVYAKELFEPSTIERLGRHYVTMLQALIEQPLQTVGAVPLMDAAEQAQLASWDTSAEQYADEQPVHRLIEAQVRRTPEAVALLFGDVQLSYAELNSRANRLAHRLIALGVRPEVRVGLALERSVEMVVALLAVLKAGGAYVPLDPEYPAERLSYMLEDSQVALLLTQSHLDIVAEGLPTLALDRLSLDDGPAHDPVVALHGEHPAYVIYTSGSTGRPKGAVNRHRSLHNRLAWMQQAYDLSPTDTVLHKTPFGFDVS